MLSDTPIFDETSDALNIDPKLLVHMIRVGVNVAKIYMQLQLMDVL